MSSGWVAAQKRIVAGRGRDKLCHHCPALIAQRGGGDDEADRLSEECRRAPDVLGQRLQSTRIGQHPIVAGAYESARMVEREANPCTGWAGQGVGQEGQEVTVRFDVEIDNLLFRLRLAATSQEIDRSASITKSKRRRARGAPRGPFTFMSPLSSTSTSRVCHRSVRANNKSMFATTQEWAKCRCNHSPSPSMRRPVSVKLVLLFPPGKALYCSWAISCAGKQVYSPHHRTEWQAKITDPAVHRRAEFYYKQFDALRPCANKCGASCSVRARNIRRGNCSARFPPSVRSGRRC